jgi:hypothetical protein
MAKIPNVQTAKCPKWPNQDQGTLVRRAVPTTKVTEARSAADLLLDAAGEEAIFDGADLADAAGVAATFEGGLDEYLGDFFDQALAQKVCREAEDVGIVMAARELGGEFVVADGGAGAFDLIGGDAHADACAADQHAPFGFSGGDGLSDIEGAFGIIDGGEFAISQDLGIVAFLAEAFGEGADGGSPTVITTENDLHHVPPVLLADAARISLSRCETMSRSAAAV